MAFLCLNGAPHPEAEAHAALSDMPGVTFCYKCGCPIEAAPEVVPNLPLETPDRWSNRFLLARPGESAQPYISERIWPEQLAIFIRICKSLDKFAPKIAYVILKSKEKLTDKELVLRVYSLTGITDGSLGDITALLIRAAKINHINIKDKVDLSYHCFAIIHQPGYDQSNKSAASSYSEIEIPLDYNGYPKISEAAKYLLRQYKRDTLIDQLQKLRDDFFVAAKNALKDLGKLGGYGGSSEFENWIHFPRVTIRFFPIPSTNGDQVSISISPYIDFFKEAVSEKFNDDRFRAEDFKSEKYRDTFNSAFRYAVDNYVDYTRENAWNIEKIKQKIQNSIPNFTDSIAKKESEIPAPQPGKSELIEKALPGLAGSKPPTKPETLEESIDKAKMGKTAARALKRLAGEDAQLDPAMKAFMVEQAQKDEATQLEWEKQKLEEFKSANEAIDSVNKYVRAAVERKLWTSANLDDRLGCHVNMRNLTEEAIDKLPSDDPRRAKLELILGNLKYRIYALHRTIDSNATLAALRNADKWATTYDRDGELDFTWLRWKWREWSSAARVNLGF